MPSPSHTVTPRAPAFPFASQPPPLRWFKELASPSLAAHAIGALFPDGERFFIRSVQRYAHRITDPELRGKILAFAAQEAHHGHAHDQALAALEAHGFEVQSWLAWYRRVAYGERGIEALAPPILRLSTTAALEHLTASLGHMVLAEAIFEGCDPVMRDLLEWHSAEEIEHKAVAFDVLQAVSQSYLVRVGGMAIGLSCLLAFWSSFQRHLLSQAAAPSAEEMKASHEASMSRGGRDSRIQLVRFALSYLRPGFHPDDVDDYPLARQTLDRLEALYPGMASAAPRRPAAPSSGAGFAAAGSAAPAPAP